MWFTLSILWHERRRFAPAVFAVAFSALLVALQSGLLLGTFSTVSLPIDYSAADLWIGSPDVLSVDMGRAIPTSWQERLFRPEIIQQIEPYVQAFASWRKPLGGEEMVIVVGSLLQDGALGRMGPLDGTLARRLREPGSVVIDESDGKRLGIAGLESRIEINGRRVHVVGTVRGLRGLAGPYVFCSLDTARALLAMCDDRATYLLARCRDAAAVNEAANRLRRRYGGEMAVLTSKEFSRQSQLHWLKHTGGGIALLCAAVLGFVVGSVVTGQTLYAAALASLREYAVLWALGTPRRCLAVSLLFQAFCVGVAGVLFALPAVALLGWSIQRMGGRVLLQNWLLGGTAVLMLGVALFAGLLALRCLRLIEPTTLMR
ncbi:MAG: ABC transporter permease [Gemmataceae bacterium]